ncbi:zinc finger protein MSN2-like isoform X1 [Argonauta hians]
MSVDLMGMKENFTLMVQNVQPWILSHFMMWLDLKVAEYKVHGCMILDQTGIASPRWLSDNICSQATRIPKPIQLGNENKDNDNTFHAINQTTLFSQETSSKSHVNQMNFLPDPITNNLSRKSSSLGSCLPSSEVQIQEFPSTPSVSSSHLSLTKRQDSYRNDHEITPNMTVPLHHAISVEDNSIDRIEIHSTESLNPSSVNSFQKPNLEKDCMNLVEEINLNYDVEIKSEPYSCYNEDTDCAPQYDLMGSLTKIDQNDIRNSNISCDNTMAQSKGTITIDLNGKVLDDEAENMIMAQKPPQLNEEQHHQMIQQQQSQQPSHHQQQSQQPSHHQQQSQQPSHQQQQQQSHHQQQQQSSLLPPVESLSGRMFLHEIPVIKLQNCNVRKVTSSTGRNKKSLPAVLSSGKLSSNSNSNPRVKIVCQICGKLFRCRSSLSRHKWLHREKRHRCFVCKKAFHRKEHLCLHMKRHIKSNQISCPICDMKGPTLHVIEEHIRQCHGNVL